MRQKFAVWGVLLLLLSAAYWLGRRSALPEPDRITVLLQIRELNQLATVKYTIQKVVPVVEQKQPVGSESLLLILQADVVAGIDLSRITSHDITVTPNQVEIRLPKPEVLVVSVNEKETKVWDRQKTWWTPWVPYSLDLEQKARNAGIESARQAALDAGILKQAERNAEAALRSLLTMSGVKTVVVIPAKAS